MKKGFKITIENVSYTLNQDAAVGDDGCTLWSIGVDDNDDTRLILWEIEILDQKCLPIDYSLFRSEDLLK